MASTILVNREGIECGKLHALQGQLESQNCYESDDALRVRCLWSQLAMVPFSLPLGFCEFFFESHVNQTVDRLETRVEFTETEDFRRNLLGPGNEFWSRRFSKT